jgi:hypothetical protein
MAHNHPAKDPVLVCRHGTHDRLFHPNGTTRVASTIVMTVSRYSNPE